MSQYLPLINVKINRTYAFIEDSAHRFHILDVSALHVIVPTLGAAFEEI